MSIFLIRYVLTNKYVLKAYGSRPGAPKRIYEYIPFQICPESSGGYMDIYSLLDMSQKLKKIYECIPYCICLKSLGG